MSGWKVEVKVYGESGWHRNAVVWPDEESARYAGHRRYISWMAVEDWRVVEVEEEPNRPDWDTYQQQRADR